MAVCQDLSPPWKLGISFHPVLLLHPILSPLDFSDPVTAQLETFR